MNRHSTSSGNSVAERDYINLSETQAELTEVLASTGNGLAKAGDGWAAYWDSYARQVVVLPQAIGAQAPDSEAM